MDVIQLTCSHCQRARYYDASAVRLSAYPVEQLSRSECPYCGKQGSVVTLNAEAPQDQELAPLPGASHGPSSAEAHPS